MPHARVTIFGVGNPGRGDDALGPALLRRLGSLAETQDALRGCRLVEAIQLQIEHALDLFGQELTVFVDATVAGRAPYSFRRVRAQRDVTYTSHAMSPAALLQVYQTVFGLAPPPAYQLMIRGACFELDAPLSELATRHLDAAWEFIAGLFALPELAQWEQHADEDAG